MDLSNFEGIIAQNVKEGIQIFVDKMKNGVRRKSDGSYENLAVQLFDKYLKKLHIYDKNNRE